MYTQKEYCHIIIYMLLAAAGGAAAYFCWQNDMIFSFISCLLIITGAAAVVANQYKKMAIKVNYPIDVLNALLTTNETYSSPDSNMTDGMTPEQRMNVVLSAVHRHIATLESQRLYYETLLSTVDTPLLVFENDGTIKWMNRCAIETLAGHALHHLNELSVLDPAFPQFLLMLRPGQIRSINVNRKSGVQELAASVTFYTDGSALTRRLVCLRNVHQLLEAKEEESWQKLVRVLTHEIMNSITPVISLSDTLCERAQMPCSQIAGMEAYVADRQSSNGSDNVSEEDCNHDTLKAAGQMSLADYDPLLFQGLQTIHRRSESLLHFVQNYRRLMRLPAPELRPMPLLPLLQDLQKLYPQCNIIVEPWMSSIILPADRGQIEQVLTNLLQNAIEACGNVDNPQISLSSKTDENGFIELCVSDNGPGILPQAMDKIFVPFYTTKTGGSGIGLSLCRQIVSRHGGNISVRNLPEGGCAASVLLPLNS